MNNVSIAPRGVICDICLGFQRSKNKCVGCNNIGNKPHHCTVCSIKTCSEKKGNEKLLCNDCDEFPCSCTLTVKPQFQRSAPYKA